jgi:hypothetical protein
MPRMMLATAVAIATFVATTAVLRSQPPAAHLPVGLTSQELSTPASRAPLRVEVLDDMTFVSPTETKK